MTFLSGEAIAPSIISASAALGGVVISATIGGLVQWRNRVYERRNRWNATLRESYAQAFASMDELSDIETRIAGVDTSDPIGAGELAECRKARVATWSRMNIAIASIDLLAPQAICDKATEASALAHLPLDEPARVKAMEAFVSETRKHLGIAQFAWKQNLAAVAGDEFE